MSFDSHSLDRLRALGRQLPQSLPSPKISRETEQEASKKLHPIETEEDPQSLFKELIKASPDGNIPNHLIAHLKEIELKQLTQVDTESVEHELTNCNHNLASKRKHGKKEGKSTKSFQGGSTKEEQSLYIDFKKLLLEDEE